MVALRRNLILVALHIWFLVTVVFTITFFACLWLVYQELIDYLAFGSTKTVENKVSLGSYRCILPEAFQNCTGCSGP